MTSSYPLLEEQHLKGLSQFQDWARGLERFLTRPCVVLLKGELAAGKTELVKSLVTYLQGSTKTSEVASPTFALQHSYKTPQGLIDHWDLYRLEDEDDLESSGFWDQMSDPQACLFVEWPERLKLEWIPSHFSLILIEIAKESPTDRWVRVFKRPSN